MSQRSIENEAFELLDACPFGIHNDQLIAPRHMPESEIVAWVGKIYAWKERIAKERPHRHDSTGDENEDTAPGSR